MILRRGKPIGEVFTPRSPDVNRSMYVERPKLERMLERSLMGAMHTLICGESGNGKSWLYKSVLAKLGYTYVLANCANASRFGSLTEEIHSAARGGHGRDKVSYATKKEASLGVSQTAGKLSQENEYVPVQEERLLLAFREIAAGRQGSRAVLVLDNLEQIFGDERIMGELANIIILLDDQRYAAHQVKLLIVGVPTGVLEYFSKTKNLESVSNRIEEIEKVGSLGLTQVTQIVERGFAQIGMALTKQDTQSISKHVHSVTLGVAQRVHEYCETLAYEIEDAGGKYSKKLLRAADGGWLKRGLRSCYGVIEGHLNSRETAVARRNQVIYAIGQVTRHQFDSNDIDEIIRQEFPETVPATNMGIGTILSDLSSGETPLVARNPRTKDYYVRDPRYIMCIRVMLRRNEDNKVQKRSFKR